MNTAKPKRWNGKMETLTAEYLNRVLEQMLTYGDRVQFALTRGGQCPHYQVINTAEKKMTFDSDHLLTSNSSDFAGSTATRIYTLEQIEATIAGAGTKTVSTGVTRGASTRTTAAQKTALVDVEKYEYFKSHRSTLPANIGKHAQEITALMMSGMSAEDAFADVIKRHP
ncbi:MAG TPA: hypothetical protein VK832_06160 [Burkholderiaceae bacterium]|nr:hypothetical protein [Burkholderiaceae bacterium]